MAIKRTPKCFKTEISKYKIVITKKNEILKNTSIHIPCINLVLFEQFLEVLYERNEGKDDVQSLFFLMKLIKNIEKLKVCLLDNLILLKHVSKM